MSGAMVPQLRFPGFEGEWRDRKVGDIFTVTRGRVLAMPLTSPDQSDDFPYPVYSSQTKNEGLAGFYTDYLFEDAVTWTTDGANAGEVRFREGKFFCTNVCGVLLNSEGEANRFTAAAIQKISRDYVSYVGNPKLMNGVMASIPILTPNIEEQQKISDFLGTVDAKLDALRRKKSGLEAFKSGLMQRLFSQEIRFTRENGTEFPDWEDMRVDQLAEVNPKNGPIPLEFQYIDLESVNAGILGDTRVLSSSEAPSRAQRNLKPNDILFQMVRPYQRNNLLFQEEGQYVASTGYAQLRAKQIPGFLYHAIHTDTFVNDVLERCTGTGYPAINSNDLAGIVLQVPHPDEQRKIADALSAMDAKIAAVANQITHMETFKKGLLQQMFV